MLDLTATLNLRVLGLTVTPNSIIIFIILIIIFNLFTNFFLIFQKKIMVFLQ